MARRGRDHRHKKRGPGGGRPGGSSGRVTPRGTQPAAQAHRPRHLTSVPDWPFPTEFTQAAAIPDSYGDITAYVIGFLDDEGHERTIGVAVSHVSGDMAVDAVLGPTFPAMQTQILVATDHRHVAPVPQLLTGREVRAQVEEALQHTDRTLGAEEHVSGGLVHLRPVIDAVLALLPAPPRPDLDDFPEFDRDEADARTAEFLATPAGVELIESFGRVEVEGIVDLIQTHAWGYCGLDAERVSPATIELFLLDYIPRKVAYAEEIVDSAPIVFGSWAAWAGARRGYTPTMLDELAEALDECVDDFADAVSDPASWGMTKSILKGMGADDLDSPEDMAAIMEAFNELPDEVRDAILGPSIDHLSDLAAADGAEGGATWIDLSGVGLADADPSSVAPARVETPRFGGSPLAPRPPWNVGLGRSLPAIELPTPDELVTAARGAPILGNFEAIAEHVGAGRPLTGTGQLKLADARTLVEVLDTGESLDRLQSAADLRELVARLRWAEAMGVVEMEAKRIVVCDDWHELWSGILFDDDVACGFMQHAASNVLRLGAYSLGWRGGQSFGIQAHEHHNRMDAGGPAVLADITAAGGATAGTAVAFDRVVDGLVELDLRDGLRRHGTDNVSFLGRWSVGDAGRYLAHFELGGLVTWHGHEPDLDSHYPYARRGGEVVLTPLGRAVAAEWLPRHGYEVEVAE